MRLPRWVELALSSIIGFIIGYFLGYYQSHVIIHDLLSIDSVSAFHNPLNKKILFFSPKPDYLILIATVDATILAFLVPYYHRTMADIREKYLSDILSERLENLSIVSYLPALLAFHIFYSTSLRYFFVDNPTSFLWLITSIISYLCFLWILWQTLDAIYALMRFSINPINVLKRLHKDVLAEIKKK